MSKFINLTNRRFRKLVIIKQMNKDRWGHYKWLCQCGCGNKIIVSSCYLINGNTKSCGCLRKEVLTKHGYCGTITYESWHQMIQRCTNHNHKSYYFYGDRGITICKRWLKFKNFLEDMGECPPGLTLERENNKKGYSPENCYWATKKQQMRNTRRNRLITYDGKTQCIAAWAEKYDISYDTLYSRLYKYNWSTEKALTTPVKKKKRNK